MDQRTSAPQSPLLQVEVRERMEQANSKASLLVLVVAVLVTRDEELLIKKIRGEITTITLKKRTMTSLLWGLSQTSQ